MSLKRQIAHNTGIQFAGKIIGTLLGLVTVMIMTRSLGVEKFGWYVTAIGFLQFVGLLSDFGFTITTASMLAEPRFDKKNLLNTIFTWRFITALVVNGLAPAVILLFPYPSEVKSAVGILSVSFFAIAINQVFTAYYQNRLQMYVQTIGDLLGRTALLFGVTFFAWQGFGFLLMMLSASVGSVLNMSYLWLRSGGVKFSLNREISRAFLKRIWPVALAVIFNSFYLQGDRVILPLYASQTDVGLYGAAYRVLDIVTQMTAMIMGIFLPLVTYSWSRGNKDEYKKRAQMGFELVSLLILPIVTGTIALAEPIMRFVAGDNFIASGKILSLLIIAIAGITFGMVFGHLNLAINKQKQVLWIYISDAVLSIIAYLIFIPRFGVYGAAGVTIFSEFYAGLTLWLTNSFYSKFQPALNNFLKILLASTLMGAVVYYTPCINLGVSIILGIVTYSALILILKIVSKETIMEILTKKEVKEPIAENVQNW